MWHIMYIRGKLYRSGAVLCIPILFFYMGLLPPADMQNGCSWVIFRDVILWSGSIFIKHNGGSLFRVTFYSDQLSSLLRCTALRAFWGLSRVEQNGLGLLHTAYLLHCATFYGTNRALCSALEGSASLCPSQAGSGSAVLHMEIFCNQSCGLNIKVLWK